MNFLIPKLSLYSVHSPWTWRGHRTWEPWQRRTVGMTSYSSANSEGGRWTATRRSTEARENRRSPLTNNITITRYFGKYIQYPLKSNLKPLNPIAVQRNLSPDQLSRHRRQCRSPASSQSYCREREKSDEWEVALLVVLGFRKNTVGYASI